MSKFSGFVLIGTNLYGNFMVRRNGLLLGSKARLRRGNCVDAARGRAGVLAMGALSTVARS